MKNSLQMYFSELKNHDLLSLSEEEALLRTYKDNLISNPSLSDKALEKLFESNMRLVISIAKTYRESKYQLEDLIQEGNMGLLKAIKKYEFNHDTKLATYATYWIKDSINKFLGKERLIRLPNYVIEDIRKLNKEIKNYTFIYGRMPKTEELALLMDKTEVEVVNLLSYMNNINSLDSLVGDDLETNFIDLISDKKALNPLELKERENLKSILEESILKLNDKEQYVLLHHLDLLGEGKKTLEMISKELNITRERCRQLEINACLKLRKDPRLKAFR